MRSAILSVILLTPLAAGCGGDPAPEAGGSDPAAASDPAPAAEEALCLDMGPQTPRDIADPAGLNTEMFPLAPAASELNLCNLHTHTNAEHKGPGFSVFVSDAEDGGYACNETADLTPAELEPAEGAYGGVNPGRHDRGPLGPHLVRRGSGRRARLVRPREPARARSSAWRRRYSSSSTIRKRSTSRRWSYGGNMAGGLHQAMMIPSTTGEPVLFRGSTTGPSYDQSTCSPVRVTWNVRPQCAKLDIGSLHRWAASGNVFEETHSHGVRQLVTAPELLAPIE